MQKHWACIDQSLTLSLRLNYEVTKIIYPKALLSKGREMG